MIGFGNIELIDDIENKKYALNMIMKKFSGKSENIFNEEILNNTVVLKIESVDYTAKGK